MKKELHSQPFRQNKLTVVIESSPTEEDRELIVLQRKGEFTEDPVVPPSRSCGTIIYDIKDGGDHVSKLQLKASTADVLLTVTRKHYQVTSDLSQFVLVGNLEVDLSEAKRSRSKYLVQAGRVSVHQGRNTASAQAILLRPKRWAPHDWTDWGLKESMSINDMKACADKPDSKFTVVATMDERIYSVQFEAFISAEDKDNSSDEGNSSIEQ
jgi:hypothetical protein